MTSTSDMAGEAAALAEAKEEERGVSTHLLSREHEPSAAVEGLLAGRPHVSKLRSFGRSAVHHFSALVSVIWDSGVACMSVASFLFSITGVLVKLMHGRLPVFEIVLARSMLSLMAAAVTARVKHIGPLFGHRKNWPFLWGRGLCGALAMTTYYVSIQDLPLADANTLFFANPSITALAAWALLREPLGLVGMAGVLVSFGGLVVLTRPPMIFGGAADWDHTRVVGTMMGLLSALLAAAAFIFIRLIGKAEPPLVLSMYFFSAAFVTSSVPLAAGIPRHAVLPRPLDWLSLVGIAATSFGGQVLIGRSFQLLPAAKASAINFTQVIYSYIMGWMWLHEAFSLLGMLGSGLIAAGVILVNLKGKKKVTPPADAAAAAAAAAAAKPTQQQQAGTELAAVAVAGGGSAAGPAGGALDGEASVLLVVVAGSNETAHRPPTAADGEKCAASAGVAGRELVAGAEPQPHGQQAATGDAGDTRGRPVSSADQSSGGYVSVEIGAGSRAASAQLPSAPDSSQPLPMPSSPRDDEGADGGGGETERLLSVEGSCRDYPLSVAAAAASCVQPNPTPAGRAAPTSATDGSGGGTAAGAEQPGTQVGRAPAPFSEQRLSVADGQHHHEEEEEASQPLLAAVASTPSLGLGTSVRWATYWQQ